LTNVDVAFITMNLPFTMPPQEAADCVKAFKPKVVYPYHYRQQGLEPADKNQQDFVAAMKGTAGIEVKAANFYPALPAPPGRGAAGGGRGGRGQ
jgi:L-ascorbate metabolism protein UlaG (beta-lactamase superfamily)